MQRRSFLQIAAASGLALSIPAIWRQGAVREARAGDGKFSGPFLVTIQAGGGWDPTSFFDPKGGVDNDRSTVNQFYTKDQIIPVGPFQATPAKYTVGGDTPVDVYTAEAFLSDNKDRLLLFNGVDTLTNNHETGTRQSFSGKLNEGYPCLAAMYAASVAKTNAVPLAFISNGGFDATQGLTSVTRSGDVGTLKRIAYPTAMDPNSDDKRGYQSSKTWEKIASMQNARLEALNAKKRLPYLASGSSALAAARSGTNELARLFENGNIPDGFELIKTDTFPGMDGTPGAYANAGGINRLVDMAQQIQLILLAFRAGLAASANIVLGGFDTHSNHDNDQLESGLQLLRGITFLFEQAKAWGLDDQIVCMVGSEFGRTPYYNDGNGKDHWNITSQAILANPALATKLGIRAGRVVGGSTDDYKAKGVDLKNPDTVHDDGSGSKISPESINVAMRGALGIDKSVTDQFPLTAEGINLA
ncbi:MAG: DUF1501 domain-containing protein [Polyangiaceae bacterium]